MINTIARLAYGVNIAKSQNIYIYPEQGTQKSPRQKIPRSHIVVKGTDTNQNCIRNVWLEGLLIGDFFFSSLSFSLFTKIKITENVYYFKITCLCKIHFHGITGPISDKTMKSKFVTPPPALPLLAQGAQHSPLSSLSSQPSPSVP